MNTAGRRGREHDVSADDAPADDAPPNDASPSKIFGLLKPQQQNCGPHGCATPQKPIQIHNHNEATIGNYALIHFLLRLSNLSSFIVRLYFCKFECAKNGK